MQTIWQPTCSLALLQLRARMLAHIRAFFAKNSVLEVETPLLSHGIGTDPQLAFFTTYYDAPPLKQRLFLQTSPEFAMKRLLAAGSGSIYQICKSFRNGEIGRFHNPEFTLLEWYRVDFDLAQLMNEVAELLLSLFAVENVALTAVQQHSYQTIFQHHTGLDPLTFDYAAYCAYANSHDLPEAVTLCQYNHALWLDFLFSHCVQPALSNNMLWLIYGYPACQSSLARLNNHDARITERVEVFINGVELGNGYHELTDVHEQQTRFEREILFRQQQGLAEVVKDERLLAALAAGLPDCSGIALGLDRILMLLAKTARIEDVVSFSMARA